MKNFTEKLCRILPEEQVHENEPMSRRTTFRAGGAADWLVEPDTEGQLAEIIRLCREQQVPWYILGNGSNLLVGDKGFHGVMIVLGKNWNQVEITGQTIRAGAGALLYTVAKQALAASLTGLEFASGIPGTIGGAVVMNAGAYGAGPSYDRGRSGENSGCVGAGAGISDQLHSFPGLYNFGGRAFAGDGQPGGNTEPDAGLCRTETGKAAPGVPQRGQYF